MAFQTHDWQRDARNPVFPPGDSFDSTACMNPFVLRRGDEYWMYYAGGDSEARKHICLATCPVDDLTNWKRLGPLFDLGARGAFDDLWCVLPCLHFVKDRWHLYYTGRSSVGAGLQSFHGMGLATSIDLLNWTRYSDVPLLDGSGFEQWKNVHGFAGGGRIVEFDDDRGDTLYRMYYTLPAGTPNSDLLVDQEKHAVCADSHDGITWFDKQLLLSPRLDATYENAATTGLNVWKTRHGYRAIYSGIGTRFGAYSICEARSDDAWNWERGEPDENLALAPSGNDGDEKWANRMCEYPNVIEENGRLRLFYCGNGYGRTGIGTALAEPIEPLA